MKDFVIIEAYLDYNSDPNEVKAKYRIDMSSINIYFSVYYSGALNGYVIRFIGVNDKITELYFNDPDEMEEILEFLDNHVSCSNMVSAEVYQTN